MRILLAAAGAIALATLAAAPPASAQERRVEHFVPDARGGTPIYLVSIRNRKKVSETRPLIAKSGVDIPRNQKLTGTYFESTQKADVVDAHAIVDLSGKIVLPYAYLDAFPVSSRIVFVKRFDSSLGFVDLETREFREIPRDSQYTWFSWQSDSARTQRFSRLLVGNRAADGSYSYCAVDRSGKCDQTITQVDGSASGEIIDRSIFAYFDKFIVRHRDGDRVWSATYRWDQSKLGSDLPPIMPVLRYNRPVNKFEFLSVLFELPHERRRIGTIDTALYWPIDAKGNPAEMPEDFVGMFPFNRQLKYTTHMGAWEGYVVVRMIDGQEQYFIGREVQTPDGKSQRPEMLAKYSDKLLGPIPDLWLTSEGEDATAYDRPLTTDMAFRLPGAPESAAWFAGSPQSGGSPIDTWYQQFKNSGVLASDPATAIFLQNQSTERFLNRMATQRAELEAEQRRRREIASALSSVRARFQSSRASCNDFYVYAKSLRGNYEADTFREAYELNPGSACRNVPESLYAGMEAAGMLRSGGSADQPPTQTFAQKVDEWNRQIQSSNDARRLERATTGRNCVTVVHVRYC